MCPTDPAMRVTRRSDRVHPVSLADRHQVPGGRNAVSLFLDENYQRFGQNAIVFHGLASSL